MAIPVEVVVPLVPPPHAPSAKALPVALLHSTVRTVAPAPPSQGRTGATMGAQGSHGPTDHEARVFGQGKRLHGREVTNPAGAPSFDVHSATSAIDCLPLASTLIHAGGERVDTPGPAPRPSTLPVHGLEQLLQSLPPCQNRPSHCTEATSSHSCTGTGASSPALLHTALSTIMAAPDDAIDSTHRTVRVR